MDPLSVSNALFSKVQQRVLGLIFGQSGRSFYMSEIIRSLGSGTGAVERELSRLERSGLVSVERIGNQKHFRANPDSPVFEDLRRLIIKAGTVAEPLREALAPYADGIKAAFVFGSVAKGSDTAQSDIDLMVIGNDLNYSDLYAALQNAERHLRRKVNPLFLSPGDWRRKASRKDSFMSKVSALPKLFVFGTDKDLPT